MRQVFATTCRHQVTKMEYAGTGDRALVVPGCQGAYKGRMVEVEVGQRIDPDELLAPAGFVLCHHQLYQVGYEGIPGWDYACPQCWLMKISPDQEVKEKEHEDVVC